MYVFAVCVHNVVCNQHGMSTLKYQSKECVCVYAPYQGLFSISHNQGVSRTHKHEIDFNWVGVNFLLEASEVRIKGRAKHF